MQRFRRRYRLVLWTAFPLLLFTLSGTLGVLYANSGWFRTSLQRELARVFPGETVRFRQLLIGADLTVTLKDVVVVHPTTHEELLTATEVRARLATDPRDLAEGRIDLVDVYLADVSTFLEFDEQGALSLVDAFVSPGGAPEEEEGDLHLSISGVRVVRSEVRLAFPEFGLELSAVDIPEFSLVLPEGELTMDGDVSVGPSRYQTVSPQPEIAPLVVELEAATLEGFAWRGEGFTFQKLEVRVPGGRLEAKGGMEVTEGSPFKLSGRFAGRADLPVASQFIGDLLQGDVDAHFQLEGPLMEPFGTYRVTSPSLTIRAPGLNPEGALRLRELAVMGSVDKGRFKLQEVGAAALDGRVEVGGTLDLGDLSRPSYDVRVRARRIDTAGLLGDAPAARPWVSGRLDLDGRLRGVGFSPDTLTVDLGVERASLNRRGGAIPLRLPRQVSLLGGARWEGGGLRLRDVVLTAGPHRVAVAGTLDPSAGSMDVTLEVRTGPLSALLGPVLPPDLGVDARASVTGKVSGPFLAPEVVGELALSDVSVRDLLSGERFVGQLAVQSGRAIWTGVDARTALGRVSFDAAVDLWGEGGDLTRLLDEPSLEVTRGRVSGLPLADLLPVDVQLNGRLDGTFAVSGKASDPRVEAWVSSGSLEAFGERIERIRVEASYQGGEVEVPSLEILMDRGRRVSGGGRVTVDGEFDGHLRGEDLPLHAMRHLAASAPDPRGRLSFDLTGSGDLSAPRVNGMIALRDLSLAGRALGDAFLQVGNRQDGSLFVQSDQVFGHFKLRARIPVDGTPPNVDVRFDKLPLERFAPELSEEGISGRVSGAGALTLDSEGAPSAGLSIDDVRINWRGRSLANRAPGDPSRPWVLGFEGGQLRLGNITLMHGASRLDVTGVVNPQARTLDVRARGVADADLARIVGEEVARAEGAVTIELSAQGLIDAPEVRGRVQVERPVSLSLRSLPGRRVTLESGVIELRPDALTIGQDNALHGTLDDGYFSVSGEVALSDLRPMDADLTIAARQIEWREGTIGLRVVANADLRMDGHRLAQTDRQLALSGLVDLLEGELRTRDDRLDLRQWVDARQEVEQTSVAADSLLGILQFREFKIIGREAFKVDAKVNNLGFALDVRPQLNLEGTALRPLLQGVVQADEAESAILYSGHKFEVVRGIAEFDQDGNPVVDIRAEAELEPRTVPDPDDPAAEVVEHDIQHVAIIVRGSVDLVRRKFDKVEVRFESQEGLTEGQTVLLIATGLMPEDLQKAAGGGSEAAVDIFLAPLLAEIEAAAQERTGDVFKKLELAPQIQTGGLKVNVEVEGLERHLLVGASAEARAGETDSDVAVTARLKVTDQFWFDVRSETTSGETQGAVRYRLTIPGD